MYFIIAIDRRVEVTHMVDIVIIKDKANLIALYQDQPPTSLSMTYFERPSILTMHVKRMSMSIDVDMGS